jgi:hypothetical protein
MKDVLHATYPDGAHDAEALLVTPDGGLFIVTKGDRGAVALYRFPRELRPGTTHPRERVGKPRGSGKPGENERISDGAVSANGEWVVLRTAQHLTFHRTTEFLTGNWRVATTVDLKAVGEAEKPLPSAPTTPCTWQVRAAASLDPAPLLVSCVQ